MTEGMDNIDKNYWFYITALLVTKYGGEVTLSKEFIDSLAGGNFELENDVDFEDDALIFRVKRVEVVENDQSDSSIVN